MKNIFYMFLQALAVIFQPLFQFFFRKNKDKLARYQKNFKDPTLSGMVTDFNVLHGFLFGSFFRRVQTISSDISKVRTLPGPVVFVQKNRGKLEYRYFNSLFLKEKLPLIHYANDCLTLFWWPFKIMWQQLICKLDDFYKNKKTKFNHTQHVETLLKEQKNVLLNLSVTRDYLFGLLKSDPMNVVKPLVEIQQNLDKPVYVVTLQFLYDKHPDKTERSYFDLLFGEKSQPGGIRKFLLFLMNYRRKPQVKFGEPINLQEFLQNSAQQDLDQKSEGLLAEIETNLKIEKARITGPLLKSKDAIIKEIIHDESFLNQLQSFPETKKKSLKVLRKEAVKYLQEMAADVNYSFIQFCHVTLGYLWNKIFDGVVLKHEQLNKIRQVAGKNPVVLVPMHRSHIDYLLISDIFYERQITYPHVCAGINLNFWPAGGIIRKGGGFFIRRTFGDNKVYKETVYAYLKRLVADGYCMEFFIEGTRSRTGKLLKPKMGILSMLMRAYFEKNCEDLYFVPIAINYDHILEQNVYRKESQGTDKKGESAGELLKARKIFKKKYGKVYIEFGDPISLNRYCDERQIAPQDVSNIRSEVSDFAYFLTNRINKIAIVTPISLVSLAVLSLNKQSVNFDELMNRVDLLKKYLDRKGAIYSDLINFSERYAYNQAIQVLCQRHILKEVETFEERFYMFDDKHRADLDFYKNNIVHFFVSLACFLKIMNMVNNQDTMPLDEIIKQFDVIKTLFRHDFTFSERASAKEHLLKVISFCEDMSWVRFDEPSQTATKTLDETNVADYLAYQGLLDNFLEAALITLRYLRHNNFKKNDPKTIIKDILVKAKPMYLKDELRHPESLSKFNLQNAFKVSCDLGVLKNEAKDKSKTLYTTTNEIETTEKWIQLIDDLLHKTPRVVGATKETSQSTDTQKPNLSNASKELH